MPLFQNLLIQSKGANGPAVLQLSAAATSTRRYYRIQETQLSSLQLSEEGLVQTGSMVQR